MSEKGSNLFEWWEIRYYSNVFIGQLLKEPTWAVPAETHGFGGWASRDPEWKEADTHAAHICQQVGCICHDGQAMCQVSTWKANRQTLGDFKSIDEDRVIKT